MGQKSSWIAGSMLKAIVSKMRQKLSCHRKNNTGEDCSWMARLKYYAYSAVSPRSHSLQNAFETSTFSFVSARHDSGCPTDHIRR